MALSAVAHRLSRDRLSAASIGQRGPPGTPRSRAGASLPLDRRRRLRADVEDDAVDALHFVDDARGDRRRAGRAAAAPSRPSCRRGSRRPGRRWCTRRSARRPSPRRSAPAAARRRTATACGTIRRARTSSWTMASARRTRSRRVSVTSPRMRTASPGPGNGWRQIRSSSMPSARPSCRTSSLKSCRSGSTRANRIRSGRPPTLWWLLIVADCPTTDTLSMTSGYSVPCARKSNEPSDCARSSNTSMNVRPMIFRFCSGSVDAGEASQEQVAGVDGHDRHVQLVGEPPHDLRAPRPAGAGRCRRRCR